MTRTLKKAAAVLSTIGLTLSDAFRLLLIRVAHEEALPFEPLIPNAVTIAVLLTAAYSATLSSNFSLSLEDIEKRISKLFINHFMSSSKERPMKISRRIV